MVFKLKKYGISKIEDQISNILFSINIPHERYKFICFKCGYVGNLKVERNGKEVVRVYHANHCFNCGIKYGVIKGLKYLNCEPDIFFNNNGILMVNGTFYHSKKRYREKDEVQINILREMGYKVYVISTEDIEAFPKDIKTWLRCVYISLNDDYEYMKLCKGKFGLANRADYSFFIEQEMEKL